MELKQFDGLPVRVTDTDGRVFEGVADMDLPGYGLHEFGREEESLRLGIYQLFESDIRSVEPLDESRLCPFYGAEYVPEEVRELYRALSQVWCAETCAPRMRKNWSPSNPTLGQCSITSFLVQDLFGAEVRGILLPSGNLHCFNVLDGDAFDLTSGQLEDPETDYDRGVTQSREEHFAREEKRERYELLKRRLEEYRAEKDR